jgi:hypothetical protein
MASGFCKQIPSTRGTGNAGCALHPRSRVLDARRYAHTSIQVQRRRSGIPCAMALRLMPCSPRRRIRLVTVIGGLRLVDLGRVDFASAQLGTSNGCRDHTVLPYATGVVRPARREPLTSLNSPCGRLARRRCRVHRIPPRVRDDRDTPLLPRRDSPGRATDLGWMGSAIFLRVRLDDPNQVESPRQIAFCAHRRWHGKSMQPLRPPPRD